MYSQWRGYLEEVKSMQSAWVPKIDEIERTYFLNGTL